MAWHWKSCSFEDLSNTELYGIMQLRQDIFVVEQNCVYPDLDDKDQGADHLLGLEDQQLLGYLRSLPPGLAFPQSSLGRIVIAPPARGRQIGRELVQRGIDYNMHQWPGVDIVIGAQAHLEDFYASLGFKIHGKPYVEDGIPHVHMIYKV